jgi:hypothetical protein
MEKPGLLHAIRIKINACDLQMVRAGPNASLSCPYFLFGTMKIVWRL